MTTVNRPVHLTYAFLIFGVFFHFNNAFTHPNVVIILADDMGFDDVSFRGSNEFITPNIDALAYSGVIFKNFYTPAMCTPSRAALLTGKYPIHTGMQHYVIPNYQPWSLPMNETTIADIFRKHGYYTSLLGKWHLGMSRQVYTPTFRGFDNFFGYLGAYVDYYDQTLYSPNKPYARGHDFRKNFSISHEHIGTYVTDLLTKTAIDQIDQHDYIQNPLFMILSHLAPHSGNEEAPLQAPREEIEKFKYIPDEDRRIYAAMMSILDRSVGEVIDALHHKGVLNNTILLFLSDNGGPTIGMHSTTASNYPLRGQKDSPWEGGIRSSAAIWTSELSSPGSVWTQKMYIADIMPTLLSAVGIELDETELAVMDGLDMWQGILTASEANVFEREIVHNIDDISNFVSYLNGNFKFINGTTSNGTYDQWLGRRPLPNSNETDPRARDYENVIKNTTVWKNLQALNKIAANSQQYAEVNITHLRIAAEVQCPTALMDKRRDCEPLKAPCLFDIDADPCETNNLYEERAHARVLEQILQRIAQHRRSAHSPNNKPEDPRCDPAFYNNEWTWWEDIQDEKNHVCGRLTMAMQIMIFLLVLTQTGVRTMLY